METTRPAFSYPEEKVPPGYCRAEDLQVIAEVLQPHLSEHTISKDTLQYSLAHSYLLGLA